MSRKDRRGLWFVFLFLWAVGILASVFWWPYAALVHAIVWAMAVLWTAFVLTVDAMRITSEAFRSTMETRFGEAREARKAEDEPGYFTQGRGAPHDSGGMDPETRRRLEEEFRARQRRKGRVTRL